MISCSFLIGWIALSNFYITGWVFLLSPYILHSDKQFVSRVFRVGGFSLISLIHYLLVYLVALYFQHCPFLLWGKRFGIMLDWWWLFRALPSKVRRFLSRITVSLRNLTRRGYLLSIVFLVRFTELLWWLCNLCDWLSWYDLIDNVTVTLMSFRHSSLVPLRMFFVVLLWSLRLLCWSLWPLCWSLEFLRGDREVGAGEFGLEVYQESLLPEVFLLELFVFLIKKVEIWSEGMVGKCEGVYFFKGGRKFLWDFIEDSIVLLHLLDEILVHRLDLSVQSGNDCLFGLKGLLALEIGQVEVLEWCFELGQILLEFENIFLKMIDTQLFWLKFFVFLLEEF